MLPLKGKDNKNIFKKKNLHLKHMLEEIPGNTD